MGYQVCRIRTGATLYSEVTDRIIAQLEEGTLPWVRPWDNGRAALGLPRNAGTGRRYSGINVLILWSRLFEQGYGSQRWLTYRQAQALGGNVRKGEQGISVCYADRFTPRDQDGATFGPDGEPRQVAFLKPSPSSMSNSAREWTWGRLSRSPPAANPSSSRARRR